MSAITLDAATCTVLRGQKQPVVLQDESGNVLGQFVPGAVVKPFTPPPLSENEIQERLKGRRYSTAEVLAKLEQRDVRN